MRTTITGEYRGRPVRLVVADGEITEGADQLAAIRARAAIAAGATVDIPGVWRGTAALDDPWALRALFSEVLGDGTVAFQSDEPPPDLAPDAPSGTVF